MDKKREILAMEAEKADDILKRKNFQKIRLDTPIKFGR